MENERSFTKNESITTKLKGSFTDKKVLYVKEILFSLKKVLHFKLSNNFQKENNKWNRSYMIEYIMIKQQVSFI